MDQLLPLLAIYFVYGLAFFSMGLVVLVEVTRTPATAPLSRLLRPLSAFGFLHSAHEWAEMFVLADGLNRLGLASVEFAWLRLVLLAASFIALAVYGVEALRYARSQREHLDFLTRFGRMTLPLFAVALTADVLAAWYAGRVTPFAAASALVRYLLAVPSAAVATLGLHAAALKARADARRPLDIYLHAAAAGFALYSLTQLVVPGLDTVFGGFVNVESFAVQSGMPIQLFRAAIALAITFSMFRATGFLEQERRIQLEQAQQARLHALEQQEALRRDLLRHTVRAQEEERGRIARELHDEMAQTLAAFALDLRTLHERLPEHSDGRPILGRLQSLSRQMSQGMYRMVHDLRPAHLDDLGLIPALKYMLAQDFEPRGLEVHLAIHGEPRRVEPRVETVVFRVAQEALTNVQRHAQVNAAEVCLYYEPERLVLRVVDHGAGFDLEQGFTAPRGWGLAGMRERAESVGGTFRHDSTPGSGTTIEVDIPVAAGLKG